MVEILCTLLGVITGVVIVAALMHHHSARPTAESSVAAPGLDEAEGLKGLTAQLQMLTHRVAADVSAHTQKVVHINERLLPAPNEPERILSAITDLIQANESMQGQLEAAQVRLSKQSEQLESTARQARTDALTGLANRRALEESLKRCIDSIDSTQATGLMLIDIDHFKSFNDNYGHITGDAVLANFARSISKWCGGKYYSARYGGEEFAIILTGESAKHLAHLASDMRAYISAQVINHEDLRLVITASAGLTTIQASDTVNRIYERADEGLYRSKKAGRNCGHWLDCEEWQPFPTAGETPSNAAHVSPGLKANSATPPKSDEQLTTTQGLPSYATQSTPNQSAAVANSLPKKGPVPSGTPQKAASVGQNDAAKGQAVSAPGVVSPKVEAAQVASDDASVLDLSAFVERMEAQLKQLRRADMPSAAIMIEAVGLLPSKVSNFEQVWMEVLEIVKANLRGIDLICRYRQNTLCVFMPGCTLNAALERAGGMQHTLEDGRTQSENEDYPERFAISAASALPAETAGMFLQRLEEAMEESQDTDMFEIVVCDEGCTYVHAS